MVLRQGTSISKYQTIRQLINDPSMKNNKNHYFYIIRVPRCGGSRIKVGKSADIVGRFKYYQSYFYGSEIEILRLRNIPNSLSDRYGENAMKLYEVFEQQAKKALRAFSDEVISNGEGKLTEWFKGGHQKELLKKYDEFVDSFKKLTIPKTEKKDSLPRKTKIHVSYKEKEEKDLPER